MIKLISIHKKCIRLNYFLSVIFVHRLANLLEFIYSESTLLNFLSSSMLICLTGFNVIVIFTNFFNFIFFIPIPLLIQIFFYLIFCLRRSKTLRSPWLSLYSCRQACCKYTCYVTSEMCSWNLYVFTLLIQCYSKVLIKCYLRSL